MRSNRSPAVYYDEMLSAISRQEEYCDALSFATFESDPAKQDSIFYRLLVLTEAASRLLPDELALCPSPNWRKIRDFGNVLRHAYDSLDLLQVWEILHDELPPLKEAIEQTMQGHFPDVHHA